MSHKVDIVAEKFEIPVNRLIIIKCKAQEVDPLLRPDEVLQFWAQVFDVRADRGIIVTTCGLTEDAIKFADHYGINIIKGKSLEDLKRNMFQGLSKATFGK
jgi:restriction endonuclease Mrr